MILFNMIMQFINAFQSFNSAFIISGGTGGPLDSTLLYSLFLYQKGFSLSLLHIFSTEIGIKYFIETKSS